MSSSIENTRKEIDQIDSKIVELLDKRAQLAVEVGKLKGGGEFILPYDPAREDEIFAGVKKSHRGPFPEKALTTVFSEIVSACRNLDLRNRIAFLGEKFGCVHNAAISQFGSSAALVPMDSGEDILAAINGKNSQIGFFPISNCSPDQIVFFEAFLAGKIKLVSEVRHYRKFSLISQSSDDFTSITDIFLTKEILAMIRKWIATISFSVKINICRTLEEVIENLIETKPYAGIVPSLIAKALGEKIIGSEIEPVDDVPFRCFAFSEKGNPKFSPGMKAGVLFSLNPEPGNLADFLNPLKKEKLNLFGIEIVRFKGKPWEELFLADFEAPPTEEGLNELLRKMEAKSKVLKFIGFFPIVR